MAYLEGKGYKFISTHEMIIYAEKQWKFIIFDISKEVQYRCRINNNIKNYIMLDFFTMDGKKVDGYVEHCLDIYVRYIKDAPNPQEIKRLIRKEKLDKITNVANQETTN